VAADPELSRELMLLRKEFEASQRQRLSPPTLPPDQTAVADAAAATAAPKATADEQYLGDQLREFVNEIKQFFEQAEENIAAHPVEGVVGALIVGVLIGRLLGRS